MIVGVSSYDVLEFEALEDESRLAPLFDWVREQVGDVAQRILSREPQLNATAQRASNILSAEANYKLAASNVRLQRGLLWLTLLLVVLTLALLAATPDVRNWFLSLV